MSMSPPPSIRAANRRQKRPKYIRTGVVACMTCRAKKIRCDATEPNCLQCTDGQRECIWPKSVPKREQLVIIPERPIPPSFLVLLFAILEYPPFNDVIHWEGVKRVVLEQPQILESYILMPVFGLRTLDAFKRKLYTLGFDGVLPHASSSDANPETSAWEHLMMTRLNPPMGFTSHDWSTETTFDEPTPEVPSFPDEVALEEGSRLHGYIPTPVSADDGKTLDWSRHVKGGSLAHPSVDSTVRHEKKLAAIRLLAGPKVWRTASKVAEDLQRRYDLLFLHLETPKPVRLTAAVRWGISNLKIPAHAWKSPTPIQVIEDYLADELDDLSTSQTAELRKNITKLEKLLLEELRLTDGPGDSLAPSTFEKDWARVVKEFISRCDHLYNTMELEPGPLSPNDHSRASSRVHSRASSISEGHVSPEDDGPSKKVVCYDE